MRDWRELCLRSLLWLLLGGWVGAWGLFATSVAPVAFRELPSAALAGGLVGPVLLRLHLYGIGAGLALAALARALGRGRSLSILPVALALLCVLSQFGVTAAISDVRPESFGPDTAEDVAARFAALHRLSVMLFGLVGLGAIALVVMHVRADLGKPTGGSSDAEPVAS